MVRRLVATGGLGMKGVDTIARIRREHFVRGKSIKQIVRELHVSRNTVRKVLRTGATAFSYEREVQPLPRIGPWREALDGLLAGNEGKPGRERLTLIRIFEDLRRQGYEGSYDALRRYAKGWRRAQATMTAAAYVPLSFAPGEAYQFDWSHEIVLINGTTVSCASPMCGCAIRGCCSCGLIRARHRRWCSTPTIGPSPSSRAAARAASTTT